MRTITATLAAIATSTALLATATPAGAASIAEEKAKLTASGKSFCTDDGNTRVRIRVSNRSSKLVRSVAYTWERTGKDARTATTWVDAPQAKKIFAIAVPASGKVKITVKAMDDGDKVLLTRTFKPLDC